MKLYTCSCWGSKKRGVARCTHLPLPTCFQYILVLISFHIVPLASATYAIICMQVGNLKDMYHFILDDNNVMGAPPQRRRDGRGIHSAGFQEDRMRTIALQREDKVRCAVSLLYSVMFAYKNTSGHLLELRINIPDTK